MSKSKSKLVKKEQIKLDREQVILIMELMKKLDLTFAQRFDFNLTLAKIVSEN